MWPSWCRGAFNEGDTQCKNFITLITGHNSTHLISLGYRLHTYSLQPTGNRTISARLPTLWSLSLTTPLTCKALFIVDRYSKLIPEGKFFSVFHTPTHQLLPNSELEAMSVILQKRRRRAPAELGRRMGVIWTISSSAAAAAAAAASALSARTTPPVTRGQRKQRRRAQELARERAGIHH